MPFEDSSLYMLRSRSFQPDVQHGQRGAVRVLRRRHGGGVAQRRGAPGRVRAARARALLTLAARALLPRARVEDPSQARWRSYYYSHKPIHVLCG